MATVNFSIPDKIKEVFNAVFAGRNKSVAGDNYLDRSATTILTG